MNRYFFPGAFVLGAVTVLWVGAGFSGSHVLALAMTAAIGAVYAFGAFELHRFRQATSALLGALSTIPTAVVNLDDWLSSVPASLQNAVRLRVEGERAGLPGPSLTPYLVGFLVMLGMLGTFLGMVVTLNGAVFALEGTTDLQAIRSAFAAPIKGLGLAFGTSVAGVATSAMLGLMSAVSRRERMVAAQLLDTRIATSLRQFSLAHQRKETFRAIQLQSQALPAVVDQLQALMTNMERMGQQLNTQWIINQESFHRHVTGVYTDLASAIDKSLRDSLLQSAQVAGDSIKPVVEAAMQGIAHEAQAAHARMTVTTQTQLDTLTSRFSATAATTGQALMDTLAQTAQAITAQTETSASNTLAEISRVAAASEELMQSRMDSEAHWIRQHGERMDQVATLLRNELGALRDAEAQRGNAAVERLGQLRAEISNSLARDNMLLEDRSRIMETLSTLLDAINHASVEQRSVIDSLVASSAKTLAQAGSQFANQVDAEATKLADIAAHVTSSAVDVSSLSETFRFAVGSFNEANEKLIAGLQRIEEAMDKSMARSDDQMAYYVAQAREIIDLSLMSQKEIFEELRQLPGKLAPAAEGISNG